jgi:hypothetical protein
MGYLSKVQLIERANQTRQFYLICPAPLAEALELEKGEPIEWIVEDRLTLPRRLWLQSGPVRRFAYMCPWVPGFEAAAPGAVELF